MEVEGRKEEQKRKEGKVCVLNVTKLLGTESGLKTRHISISPQSHCSLPNYSCKTDRYSQILSSYSSRSSSNYYLCESFLPYHLNPKDFPLLLKYVNDIPSLGNMQVHNPLSPIPKPKKFF